MFLNTLMEILETYFVDKRFFFLFSNKYGKKFGACYVLKWVLKQPKVRADAEMEFAWSAFTKNRDAAHQRIMSCSHVRTQCLVSVWDTQRIFIYKISDFPIW